MEAPPVPTTGNVWLDLMANAGMFGIVCFVIWWTFTKTQPRYEAALKTAQESFQASLTNQADSHQKVVLEFCKELNDGRLMFARVLEEERNANSRDIDRLIDEMRRMNAILIYIVGQLRGKELSGDEQRSIGLVVKEPSKAGA